MRHGPTTDPSVGHGELVLILDEGMEGRGRREIVGEEGHEEGGEKREREGEEREKKWGERERKRERRGGWEREG